MNAGYRAGMTTGTLARPISRAVTRPLTLPVAVWLGCLAYTLFRPVSNGQILYPLLALMTVISLGLILTRAKAPPRWFVLAVGLLLTAVVIGAYVGSTRSTLGLQQQSTQWFGAVLIWSVWAAAITLGNVRRLLTVITVVTAALSAVIVLYVAGNQGIVPQVVPKAILVSQNAAFDLTDSGSAIRLYGLSTLAGAGPLVAAMTAVRRDTLLPPRWLTGIATALAVGAALLGGRRGIAVVMALTPLLLWVLRTRRRGERPKLAPTWVVMSPVFFLAAVYAWTGPVGERIKAAFADVAQVYFGVGTGSGAESASNAIRRDESAQLLAGWDQHPMFGAGLGGTLPNGYARSTRTWAFELQYHQMLFDLGIVGFTLVALALVIAGVSALRVARQIPEHAPAITACAVGAAAMLVANASNPYLQAVGHGWAVALVGGVAAAVWRDRHLL